MPTEHVLQNARSRLRGSTDGTADRVMGQLSSVIGGARIARQEGWEIVRCRRPRRRARVAVGATALAAGWLYARAANR